MSFPSLSLHSKDEQVSLGPNEQAIIEAHAMTDYSNPAFSPDVVASAAQKAEERRLAVSSAEILETPKLTEWIHSLGTDGVEFTEADLSRGAPYVRSLFDTGRIGEQDDDWTAECISLLADWKRRADDKPEYTADEALVVRAALGWRALTARQPADRTVARAALEALDSGSDTPTVAWAHCRYAAHIVARKSLALLS